MKQTPTERQQNVFKTDENIAKLPLKKTKTSNFIAGRRNGLDLGLCRNISTCKSDLKLWPTY